MTYTSAREALQKYIYEALSDEDLTFAFDDMQFTPPPADKSWVRISIRHDMGQQKTLNTRLAGRLFDREGQIWLQFFTPFGNGSRLADRYCNIVSKALNNANDQPFWVRNVTVREIGKDGNWFQTNVHGDFTYEEVE